MYKMAILSKIKSHSDVINYFKELPFYNKPIEKPVKRLKNIDPLAEQLSVIKTDQAFKGYAMLYKVKIVKKDPIVQLEAIKLSIKNLFSDLLNEITVKVLLKRYKHNGEIEFKPVYSNAVAKTVTNHIFRIEIAFQEVLYIIDVWINSESGWIIESIKSQYINILNL